MAQPERGSCRLGLPKVLIYLVKYPRKAGESQPERGQNPDFTET